MGMGTGAMCSADRNMCERRFKQMINSNDVGGLGKAYCVVDNTGRDGIAGRGGREGMSEQRTVLVLQSLLDDGGYHEQRDTTKKGSHMRWEHGPDPGGHPFEH